MSMADSIRTAGPVTVYPYAGLMHRILAYYDLEYSPALCFGLGCELDFVLPEAGTLRMPRAPGFNGSRFYQQLSRAVGMWYREVRSHTASTFVHYLDLEWEDFAGKMQPLPILTHLSMGQALRPVLLIDRSTPAEYTFLCGLTGEELHLHSAALAAMSLPEYGHAIFHQPLNIIKHPTKYRPLRKSVTYALRHTVHQLTAGFGEECGLPALHRFIGMLGGATLPASDLLALADYYLAVSRDNQGENGLYRLEFAAFLEEAGHLLESGDLTAVGPIYRELAARWGLFLQACGRFSAQEIGPEAFCESARTYLTPIAAEEERAVMMIGEYLENKMECRDA